MKRLGFLLFRKISKLLSNKGLDKVPGMVIIYNSLLRYLRPKGIVLTEVQGNKMYVNADDRVTGLALLMRGIHEKHATELVKGIISEGMTVVDIGANIGYYTLIAAKLVGNSGKVYASEPAPDNYQVLIRNIELNAYTNVIPVNKAISNECGTTKLFINRVSSSNQSFSQDNITDKAGAVEVETVTLDEFFKHQKVDFIKIDVEGAEGLIVDGAMEILKQDGLKVMMEFWPAGLSNLGTEPLKFLYKLQEIGFSIKLIDKTTRCLQPADIMEFIQKIEVVAKQPWGTAVNLLLEK